MSKLKNQCANISMEENFFRMSIYFDNLDFRKVLSKAEKKFNIKSDSFVRNLTKEAGNYSIEFKQNNNRISGDFATYMLKELGIDKCEV